MQDIDYSKEKRDCDYGTEYGYYGDCFDMCCGTADGSGAQKNRMAFKCGDAQRSWHDCHLFY